MSLLEIVYDGGPVLDVVFAAQRARLAEEIGEKRFQSLDLQRKPTKARAKLLQAAARKKWKAILVRGVRGLDEALPFFPNTAFFLDHVAGFDFGPRHSLSRYAHRLSRAFTYSAMADTQLRDAGFGKITTMAGPFLPDLELPAPTGGPPILGLLDIGHGARLALARIKKVRRDQGWDFRIVTTLKDSQAEQVENAFEVAEQCNLLVCPMESKDYGEPHQAAILALSVGRALCTSQTAAMLTMPYVRERYVHVQKYSLGGFGTCWEVYRRSRARFDEWPAKAQKDDTRVVREILTRL